MASQPPLTSPSSPTSNEPLIEIIILADEIGIIQLKDPLLSIALKLPGM
jgi:hypothetical protein